MVDQEATGALPTRYLGSLQVQPLYMTLISASSARPELSGRSRYLLLRPENEDLPQSAPNSPRQLPR
jgi:hypothetical protein